MVYHGYHGYATVINTNNRVIIWYEMGEMS